MEQPGQSLCSRKAAHQTKRIFRWAVLLHGRTFGLIQAAPYEKKQASLENSFKRATGRRRLGAEGWAGEKRLIQPRLRKTLKGR